MAGIWHSGVGTASKKASRKLPKVQRRCLIESVWGLIDSGEKRGATALLNGSRRESAAILACQGAAQPQANGDARTTAGVASKHLRRAL